MITLREILEDEDLRRGLTEDQFLDLPLVVVDPQNEDDGAFPLDKEYDLTVTIGYGTGGDTHEQAVLLRVMEDWSVRIIHD